MDPILDRSVPEIARLVREGEVSAEEVTRASLARIERQNGTFGAFLTVQGEAAIAAARSVDARRAKKETLGPLAGVPIGIKDALSTRDAPTTAGSAILIRAAKQGEAARDPYRGYRPPYDATVVARLRTADAILVGKCNMDEFAMGSSNENSAFFPARNPWDPTRTPGGSSGGSAVTVALGMTPASLGSDTGGSIRQPASLTGVVGVKPTYGRVSRYGLIAFASSLDQVGPFARDVRSAARVLETIAGHDGCDATSIQTPVGALEAACDRDPRGLRLGVPEEYFQKGLAPEVEASIRQAIGALASLGCTIVPIRLPHTRYAIATYYVIATAECSSNLARFDGVRFGLRVDGAGPKKDLGGMYAATRGAGFGAEVKRRIALGTYVLSAGYYDAYYARAQKVRTVIRREFEKAFTEVDAIVAPVSPTVAFKLGERVDDPLAMYLADAYSVPASLAGLPAVSVPAAPAPAKDGAPELPIGLQLIAPPLEEARLFTLAAAFEAVSPARGRRPPGAGAP